MFRLLLICKMKFVKEKIENILVFDTEKKKLIDNVVAKIQNIEEIFVRLVSLIDFLNKQDQINIQDLKDLFALLSKKELRILEQDINNMWEGKKIIRSIANKYIELNMTIIYLYEEMFRVHDPDNRWGGTLCLGGVFSHMDHWDKYIGGRGSRMRDMKLFKLGKLIGKDYHQTEELIYGYSSEFRKVALGYGRMHFLRVGEYHSPVRVLINYYKQLIELARKPEYQWILQFEPFRNSREFWKMVDEKIAKMN